MKIWFYCKNEIKRLLLSQMTWITILLCLLSPIIGFFFPVFVISSSSDSSSYLGNPVLACGVLSLCLFFMLALYTVSRENRSGVDRVTQSVVSVLPFQLARLIAFLFLGGLVSILLVITQSLVWYIFFKNIFSFTLCIVFYCIVVPIGTWMGAILGLAFYQIMRNVSVSVVIFLMFFIFGFSNLARQKLFLSWINPLVPTVSDGYSNAFMLRTVLFTRCLYLIIFIGIWLLSLLCIRKYEKNIWQSLAINSKKIYLPIGCILCMILAGTMLYKQPFFDHSTLDEEMQPKELDSIIPEKVSITSLQTTIKPNILSGKLTGSASFKIDNPTEKKAEMSFLINAGYKITSLKLNGTTINYKNLNDDALGDHSVLFTLPTTKSIELKIIYEGFPKMRAILQGQFGESEIGPKFIHLSRGAVTPIIVSETQFSYPVDVTVILPVGYTALNIDMMNTTKKTNSNGTISWNFKQDTPYVDIFCGKFKQETIELTDKTIDFYYSKYSNIDSKKIIELTKKSMEYNTKHYGTQAIEKGNENNRLTLFQITAFQFGGFAAPGFSCLDESYFSIKNTKDILKGGSVEETLLHELTHQWWGIGKYCQSSDGTDGWTDEGLTVYTTYRIAKEIYGEEYAKKYYLDVWQTEVNNMYRTFYYSNPKYLENIPTFLSENMKLEQKRIQEYCEVPLKILKAEKLIGGEEKMDQVLYNLMQDDSISVITYEDFLTLCHLKKEELILE